jgi:hypothetical protein
MVPASAPSYERTGFERSGLRVPSLPGWLRVGALAAIADLGVAAAYWGGLSGTAPVRMPQSVASWVLGPAAFAGGAGSATLGLVLYMAVVAAIVAAFQALCIRFVAPGRHLYLLGAGYGVAAYLVLFHVVVPYFTAATVSKRPWHWEATCAVAYAVLVGMPSAWLARSKR